jgi:hypothetical protein
MRGVKSSHPAASFVVGHALMRNICRGFYRRTLLNGGTRVSNAWS